MSTALPLEAEPRLQRSFLSGDGPHRGVDVAKSCSEATIARPTLQFRVIWSVVGNTARALTQVGYLFAFAQLGSLEMAGQYALGLAVTAPIFMFLNLGLRQLQGTDTEKEYAFSDYLGLRLLTTTMGMFLVGAVVTVLGYPWSSSLIILAVAGTRAVEAIADTFHGLFQQQERNDRIAQSQGAKCVASLGTLVLALWLSGSALFALGAATVVRLLILLTCDLPWGRLLGRMKPRFRRETLVRLGSLAAPLGIVAMFLSLSANIPRYFLSHYHGDRILGVYAMLELFLQLVLMVTVSIQQATSARMAGSFFEGGKKFRRYLSLLLAVGVAWGLFATLAAYGCGQWVLSTFLGSELAMYHGAFTLLMAAAIGINIRCFLGAAMVIMRRTRIQAVLTAISAAATLVLAWLLIPGMGVVGAALTMLASGVVFSLLTASALVYCRDS
jgi:O-antigen/teichoic acid export membrane protein